VHALRVGEDAAVADGAAGPQDPVQRVRGEVQVRAAGAGVQAGSQSHVRADAALQLAPQGHGAAPPEGAGHDPRQPTRRRGGGGSRLGCCGGRRAEVGAHVPRLRRVLACWSPELAMHCMAEPLRDPFCQILPFLLLLLLLLLLLFSSRSSMYSRYFLLSFVNY
jgi:hypothetical protein